MPTHRGADNPKGRSVMAICSGLLVRDNFADTGTVPSTGTIWTSPDIIPYGQDVLSSAQAVSTYKGPDIGRPVVNNLNNNIYVRCRNVSNHTMTGNVNLYYANSSLFLLPNTWTQLKVPTVNNAFVTASGPAPSTSIPEGIIGMVQAPFNLSHVPPEHHFCFIAVVNDNNVPFPIPAKFASNAAFASWVASNPSVAWRNIVLCAGSNSNVTSYQTFGNCNPIASTFIFSMVGKNLPPGTTWQAHCADKRLPQAFSASGTFSTSGTASLQMEVPPNIGGGNPLLTMAFTYTAPGGQAFPKNAVVTVTYYQVPTVFEQSPQLVEEEKHVVRDHVVAAPDGGDSGFATMQLLLLGSVEVQPTFT
ncbi:hypothetical protein [Pendulispora albinea]|uniref:Capsid protein n=1 Tax=Pendulispora albinea TaxID=2741071 RepID=A0ABZ2M4K6_9BACT